MSKQSNKQTQNVHVVVNNKMGCCEKPKRKRKSKPKQEDPPMDDGGFPVLNTPAQTRPNYSALPVRNTVYMPSTVQISPEGMMPPVPDYFNKQYTNLVRTMEDFHANMLNEWREWQQSMQPTISPSVQQEAQTDFIESTKATPALTMADAQSLFDIQPSTSLTTSPAPTPSSSSIAPNVVNEDDNEPLQNLITAFDKISVSGENNTISTRRQHYIDNFNEEAINEIYQTYINKFNIKKSGKPAKQKLTQINNILKFEDQYGKLDF